MEFGVQELAEVLAKTVFPEGYRLYDFTGGQRPTIAEHIACGAFITTRYVGIQRDSDGRVFFLEIK